MPLQATPLKQIVYIGNTNVLNVEGLQDQITNSYLNAATLVATLIDDQGNKIAGCTAIALPYVVGSNGNYQGTFGDNNFNPNPGTGYTLILNGNQGSGYFELQIVCEVRNRQQ